MSVLFVIDHKCGKSNKGDAHLGRNIRRLCSSKQICGGHTSQEHDIGGEVQTNRLTASILVRAS